MEFLGKLIAYPYINSNTVYAIITENSGRKLEVSLEVISTPEISNVEYRRYVGTATTIPSTYVNPAYKQYP